MPRRKKKLNSLLFRKTHIRQKNNDNYEHTVIMMCCKNVFFLLILLGVGSSHSIVDVRMVHVVFRFSLIDRFRTAGRISSIHQSW